MADFLLLLGRLNLAVGAAIIAVYLLRRPLRMQFGAPIAYAIWLLVPMAGLASADAAGRRAAGSAFYSGTLCGGADIGVTANRPIPPCASPSRLMGQSTLAHPMMAAERWHQVTERPIPRCCFLWLGPWAQC